MMMKDAVVILLILAALIATTTSTIAHTDKKKHHRNHSILTATAVTNFTSIVRVGLMASSPKSVHSDQGFAVRRHMFMRLVDNQVYNGTLFQIQIYYCNRHNSPSKFSVDCVMYTMCVYI